MLSGIVFLFVASSREPTLNITYAQDANSASPCSRFTIAYDNVTRQHAVTGATVNVYATYARLRHVSSSFDTPIVTPLPRHAHAHIISRAH